MPLTINCGLSRKNSKDYNSSGVSINVTAELDQSLLARPDELQEQVANLYAQAEQALDRQAGSPAQAASRSAAPRPARQNGGYRNVNGNGHGNGTRTNGNGGGMTESQRKAILAIARRANVDPNYEAEQMIGTPFEQLSIRQASELIDHLKALAPADSGR